RKTKEESPVRPRQIQKSCHPDLEILCLKCLEKEPEKRVSSAGELSQELNRFLTGRPIQSRPIGPIERGWLWCRRNPVVAGLVSLSALLLLGFGIAGFVALDEANQRQAAEVARINEAKKNDKKRTSALEETVLTAPPQAVPYAIDHLAPLKDHAIPLLQDHMKNSKTEASQRLHAACALMKFGHPHVDVLVSAIADVDHDEFSNIVEALDASRDEASRTLKRAIQAADDSQNWKLKFRLVVTALCLGDSDFAAEMVSLQSDPLQRTTFIHSFPNWHGSLTDLAESIPDLRNGPLRSALCLALGEIPSEDVSDEEIAAWKPLLQSWYQVAEDGGTHGAADWILRQWEIPLPEIPSSAEPALQRTWFVNSMEMTMLRIPSGTFQMGSNSKYSSHPVHQVTLTRPFFLSNREVSVGQFLEFIEDPNCPDEDKPQGWRGHLTQFSPTDDHPIQRVSWFDAVLYCNWLSRKENLKPCYTGSGRGWKLDSSGTGYRLPTEAEWEYACRAGTHTNYYFGNQVSMFESYGICKADRTGICGSRMPNPWGFFNFHGNVSEWCHDGYGEIGKTPALVIQNKPISSQPATDPEGTSNPTHRIVRGGDWRCSIESQCSAVYRGIQTPEIPGPEIGFRVLCSHPERATAKD
ncbi:MAG: SUMF1/EgtB/PvdO family nonheme iron enzyme, partial [Planctomycetaceae bacterium]|nr:SUMF1/EgtB/PvdO family nonheme iron enzyme [Planctomycetaceae bacterium]